MPRMGKKDIIMTKQDHDDLIKLSGRVDLVQTIVNEIKDNHLVHIATQIETIQTNVGNLNVKLAMWSGGIVVAVWIMERFI